MKPEARPLSEEKWWDASTVAVVTGANKVGALAQHHAYQYSSKAHADSSMHACRNAGHRL
jgi:hypothetical protein